MKRIVIAAMAMAAGIAAAEAKCSTKSLNGNWFLHTSDGNSYAVSIAGGKLETNMIPFDTSIKLGENCRGKGTAVTGMQTYQVDAAAEHIAATSPMTPNLLYLTFKFDDTNASEYVLFRKSN
jgi:hypothetical protein